MTPESLECDRCLELLSLVEQPGARPRVPTLFDFSNVDFLPDWFLSATKIVRYTSLTGPISCWGIGLRVPAKTAFPSLQALAVPDPCANRIDLASGLPTFLYDSPGDYDFIAPGFADFIARTAPATSTAI